MVPSHALPGAGQRAVLRHDAEALAEVRERALADVRAVQEHAPVVGVVEAEEQLQQRGPRCQKKCRIETKWCHEMPKNVLLTIY